MGSWPPIDPHFNLLCVNYVLLQFSVVDITFEFEFL